MFDTLLVVENYPVPHESKSSTSVLHCVEIHNRGYTHYQATLLVLPGEGISLHLEYRPSLRDP